MTRTTLAALLAVLLPTQASAVSAPDCWAAMDIDPNALVAGSLSYTLGDPAMVDVRSSLGQYGPFQGGTMCLLSTGIAADVTQLQDHDWPGTGGDTSVGDRIEISFDLVVPPWANSFFFRHNFFTREYPEWVGSAYNDAFEIQLSGAAWAGQIAYDALGSLITVNSGFFVVTDPADLVGTGFDQDGSTGWLVSIAPVQPNDVITLTFTVYDVADGVWDSAALLDDFEWSSSQITLPHTDHADSDGGFTTPPPGWIPEAVEPVLSFLSPKEAPLEGDREVTLVGQDLGAGMQVWLGEAPAVVGAVTPTTATLLIPSASAAGVPEGGPVDVRVVAGEFEVLLVSGFTYHPPEAEGAVTVPPRIDLVWPLAVEAERATQVEITGPGLLGGQPLLETQDGRVISLEVVDEVSLNMVDVLTVALPPLGEGVTSVRVRTKGATPRWAEWLRVEAVQPVEAAAACSAAATGAPGVFALLVCALALVRRRS